MLYELVRRGEILASKVGRRTLTSEHPLIEVKVGSHGWRLNVRPLRRHAWNQTLMSYFREHLGDPDLIRFYDFWAALRGDRAMPSRKDLDPLHIPPEFLPNLMLIDVLSEPRRYRYRLVGTHVTTASGEDRTGQTFEKVGFFKVHPVVLEQYDRVVNTGQPLHSLEPFTNFISGSTYDVDRLLLPLSSDGRTVDMLIVLFHFKTGPFARSLVKPIRPKKLPSRH